MYGQHDWPLSFTDYSFIKWNPGIMCGVFWSIGNTCNCASSVYWFRCQNLANSVFQGLIVRKCLRWCQSVISDGAGFTPLYGPMLACLSLMCDCLWSSYLYFPQCSTNNIGVFAINCFVIIVAFPVPTCLRNAVLSKLMVLLSVAFGLLT